jgi:nucleoside-diphosphate-sugar epimerase
VFGDGAQVRDFTYVADVVAANLAAASAIVEAGSVFNVAGGTSIEVNALLALLGELLGREVEVERLPAQPGDVRRTGGAIERAADELGWRPVVSLRDGLLAQIDATATAS